MTKQTSTPIVPLESPRQRAERQREALRESWGIHWSPIHPVTTCDGCSDAGRCPYAFDDYNTDGDCLASK